MGYHDAGHVRHIVTTNDPQSNVRDAVALFYTKGSQLWLAVWERWTLENGVIQNRERLAATEYLTDGVGIARWLVRRLDPAHDRQGNPTTSENPLDWALVSERLTDFAGDERDQDYAVPSGTTVSPTRRYFGGDGFTNLAAGQTFYVHSNQVGTNELATRADTSRATRNVYSAFGEPVFAASLAEGVSRHGYAGAFGYEGADDAGAPGYVEDVAAQAGLLHVGARYYDPAGGRFVMRDPIGIGGGLNAYEYVHSQPVFLIDPLGESSWWPNTGFIRYGPSRVGFHGRDEVYRLAYRIGSRHIYGARGAMCFGTLVAGAAAAGYIASQAIEASSELLTGESLSTHIGQSLANASSDFWGGDSVFVQGVDLLLGR